MAYVGKALYRSNEVGIRNMLSQVREDFQGRTWTFTITPEGTFNRTYPVLVNIPGMGLVWWNFIVSSWG